MVSDIPYKSPQGQVQYVSMSINILAIIFLTTCKDKDNIKFNCIVSRCWKKREKDDYSSVKLKVMLHVFSVSQTNEWWLKVPNL